MEAPNYSFCPVCSKHFSGIEPYLQHMNSEKHKRKVMVSQSFGLTASADININVKLDVKQDLSSVTMPNSLFCDVCKVQMTGPEAFYAHLKGAPHAKRVRNMQLLQANDPRMLVSEEKLGSSFRNLEVSSSSDNSTISHSDNNLDEIRRTANATVKLDAKHEMSNISVINSFFCDICTVQMTGPEAHAAHMKGAPHAKRVRNMQLLQANDPRMLVSEETLGRGSDNLEVSNSSDTTTAASTYNFDEIRRKGYRCDTCETSMSGMEAYISHMKGAPHAKRVRNLNLRKNMEMVSMMESEKASPNLSPEGNINASTDEPKSCLVKDRAKRKSDEIDTSEVKIQKLATEENDISTFTVNSSFGPDSTWSNPGFSANCEIGNPNPTNVSFFCDLCQVTISGKINYEQHLSGSSHAKKLAQQQPFMRSEIVPLLKLSPKTPALVSNNFCSTCEVSVYGKENYNHHVEGAQHKKMEQQLINSLQLREISPDFDSTSNQSEENKSVEELKESLSDVVFCHIDQDPRDVIKW